MEGRPIPRDEWHTPPALFAHLDGEFHFEVDAACTAENCLCPLGLTSPDGLLSRWPSGRSVWLNPPYSATQAWLEKALAHDGLVVCLIPADTSTGWWERLVAARAAEVRFVAGRVRFLAPGGGGPLRGGMKNPSAVVVYRPGARAAGPRYSLIPREAHRLTPPRNL